MPNLVTVKVGPDGKVKVYNAGGQTHVIFDVVGYYSTTPAPTPPAFTAANPAAAGPLALGMTAMSIDMKDAANANNANVLGPLDTCARINENGVLDADEFLVDQLRIDVTAQGIPAFNDGGTPSVEGDDSGGIIGLSVRFQLPAAHLTLKSRKYEPVLHTSWRRMRAAPFPRRPATRFPMWALTTCGRAKSWTARARRSARLRAATAYLIDW